MSSTATRQRPAALTLTPAAEARIAELMSKAPADAIGVNCGEGPAQILRIVRVMSAVSSRSSIWFW